MLQLTSNLLLLIISILNTGNKNGSLVREDQAILGKVLVPGVKHSVKHALVQKEVTHPLGNYDVDLGERDLDLFHLSLDQGDLVGHSVDLDDFPSLEDDGGHINTNNVLRTSLDGEPIGEADVSGKLLVCWVS